MAFNWTSQARNLFSIFKKKVIPIQTNDYKTPEDLFRSLTAFESQLSPLELKKMPKTLQNFSSKMRRLLRNKENRLIDVEMQLSHTFESYSKNADELIFGSEEVEVETTLQQMATLTNQMVKYDLNAYVKHLLPQAETYRTLYERLLERFLNIEERIGREIYKGYFRFSKKASKVAFLEQREYKGDFKFQLTDDNSKLEVAIEAIYNCALFNKMRDKLSLACELAIVNKWTQLSSLSVSRLLFCLANSGRNLKFIEDNFHSIKQKVESYPLELLYYMMVSGVEDAVWFQFLSNQLILRPRNIHEQFISGMIQFILKQRFDCSIKVEGREQYNLRSDKHEGQLFLQHFLSRYGYSFTTETHPMFPYTIYQIQSKKFICIDHWAIKEESLQLNGIGQIIKQYYHRQNEPMKHINWPRMMGMDKRGPRDEYVLSKFKGIERPKKQKIRYYE